MFATGISSTSITSRSGTTRSIRSTSVLAVPAHASTGISSSHFLPFSLAIRLLTVSVSRLRCTIFVVVRVVVIVVAAAAAACACVIVPLPYGRPYVCLTMTPGETWTFRPEKLLTSFGFVGLQWL